MNTHFSDIKKHLFRIIIIGALLCLLIVYPFLPGDYEAIATTLSLMVQVFGLLGLPLSVIGICWWMVPTSKKLWATTAYIVGIALALIQLLIAILSIGYAFAALVLLGFSVLFYYLFQKLQLFGSNNRKRFNAAAIYLTVLPLCCFIMQLLVSQPLTRYSRNKAIQNATGMISEIEAYHQKCGSYPPTLQAQWKDYSPNIVGIEKYFYSPQGKAYNLQFEQPRFLLDRFGTREWVVYNPRDENSSYSHTSWYFRLSPGEVMRTQGWYSSGNTGYPHWKYFLFD
jgi:hypothetical protein